MSKDTDKKNADTGKDALVVALCGAIPAKGEIPETSRKFVEEGIRMALADAGVPGKVAFEDNPAGIEAVFDYAVAEWSGHGRRSVSAYVVVTRTGIVAEASYECGHGNGFRRTEIGTFSGFLDVVGRLCHGALLDALVMDMDWAKKDIEYVREKLASGAFGG